MKIESIQVGPRLAVAGNAVSFSVPATSTSYTPDFASSALGKLKIRIPLTGSHATVNAPIWTGGTIVPGLELSVYMTQSAPNCPSPAWDATAFGTDVSSLIIDGTNGTRTAVNMTFWDDNLWHLDSFSTGQ